MIHEATGADQAVPAPRFTCYSICILNMVCILFPLVTRSESDPFGLVLVLGVVCHRIIAELRNLWSLNLGFPTFPTLTIGMTIIRAAILDWGPARNADFAADGSRMYPNGTWSIIYRYILTYKSFSSESGLLNCGLAGYGKEFEDPRMASFTTRGLYRIVENVVGSSRVLSATNLHW